MDIDVNIVKLKHRIEKRRYSIEALKSIKDEIDEKIETDQSLLLDNRIELIDRYVDDDELADQILTLDPESPLDLLRSLREILGRDPPVLVVRELLIDYEYEQSDLLELRRHDDVEVIDVSLDSAPKIETFHMTTSS